MSNLKVGSFIVRNTKETLNKGVLIDDKIWVITKFNEEKMVCDIERIDGSKSETIGIRGIHAISESKEVLEQIISSYKDLLTFQRDNNEREKSWRERVRDSILSNRVVV